MHYIFTFISSFSYLMDHMLFIVFFFLKPYEGQEQNYAMGNSSTAPAKYGLMDWMHCIQEFAFWLERRDENEQVSLSQEVIALI